VWWVEYGSYVGVKYGSHGVKCGGLSMVVMLGLGMVVTGLSIYDDTAHQIKGGILHLPVIMNYRLALFPAGCSHAPLVIDQLQYADMNMVHHSMIPIILVG